MSLDLLDERQQATNLIVSVGKTGALRDEAINPIVAALKKKNCRLLGWQLYAADSDNFNNFVLQLGDMIDAYADSQAVDKRKMLFYAELFCRSNLLRDAGNNFFILDYPYASMTQGGFLFPEKGETLSVELFIGAVDSIMSKIRADNRLDGSKFYKTFDVTEQIHTAADPRNIEILIDGLELPKPIINGGGFNPDVSEWGEGEDVEIQM